MYRYTFKRKHGMPVGRGKKKWRAYNLRARKHWTQPGYPRAIHLREGEYYK